MNFYHQAVGVVNTEQIFLDVNLDTTGWVRLIRSHSSAKFCFELSENLNYKIICNSNFAKNFGLEISLN